MINYIENGKVKIFVNQSLVESSKTAIILIHGLAEHSGRYESFITNLNKNCYSVFAIDLRGHGQTISKKGDCENINKVIEDMDKVVEYIKTNYNYEKVGIFGHSIGGLIASLYASIYKGVDFLVLSSPAIYCPKKLNVIKFIPYKLLPFIYFRKKHSESQEMLEVNKNDPLALHSFSIRTIGIFFNDGIKLLTNKLNIKCPVLLLCGKQDRLLNEQQNFERFMSKLTNKQNKLISYDNAKHRIVHNEGSHKRINDLIKWLNIVS